MSWFKNWYGVVKKLTVPTYSAEHILETVEPVSFTSGVIGQAIEMYFYKIKEPQALLLMGRLAKFLEYAYTMTVNDYIIPDKKLGNIKYIFVPKEYKPALNDLCQGTFAVAYGGEDNQTLFIMIAKDTGKNYKHYKDFAFWEHAVAHAIGVFDKKHKIMTERFNKKITKGFRLGAR